jgi:ADP-ribose pyrophosphatase YjhB (NUDIX family)
MSSTLSSPSVDGSGMPMKSSYTIFAVRVVVRNSEGKILFLQRQNTNHGQGAWCLPGGKVGGEESTESAAKKELKEETDLDCTGIRFLSCRGSPPSQNDHQSHYLILYFECQTQGEIHLNSESSDFRWLSPEELIRYPMAFEDDVQLLKEKIFVI